MPEKITEESLFKCPQNSDQLVILEIGFPWCGSCSIMEPILNQLASEFNDRIRIYKINIDIHDEIIQNFRIDKLPLYLFYRKGKLIDHIIGLTSKSNFSKKIYHLINSNQPNI